MNLILKRSFVTSNLLRCLFLLLLVPYLTSCSNQRTIVNALDEKEANEILVFLSTKGIDASKIQNVEAAGGAGGTKMVLWDIQVPGERVTEAMALLNQAGLPRRRGQSLLNIFAGGGLVPSELQEKIRYQAGLAEQTASTIRKIDGILDAEVQISFPEEDPLSPGKKKGRITASVYVKHSGVLDDPNSQLIPKIKRLVAASVTGLDYDDVTVIGDRARYSTPVSGLASLEEEKQFVSIWTIILSTESVTRFRILFFSFLLTILLLTLALIWTAWKVYPYLKRHGGIKQLFHLHPIPLDSTETTPAAEAKKGEEAKKSAEQAKKKAEDEGQIDQEIDET